MASPISAEAAREARLLDALLERLRQRPGGRAGMAVDPSAPELNAVLTGLVQTEREKRKNTQSGQDQGGSPLECGTEGVEVKFVACNALPCGALDFELRRFCPHSVVLYDPELAAVRECESYCAEVFAAVRGLEALSSRKRDQPEGAEGGQVASVGVGGSGGAGWIRSDLAVGSELCVDILVYAESAEQHRFRTSVEKEKDAWESLIRQKKHLLVPVSELSTASDDAILRLIESSGTAAQNLGPLWSSRKAGGGRARALQIASLTLKPSVIVDMREFSAGLPAALFGAGLTLTPVTITVGDYILSRDICIERKSVPDLVQSFHSGRLFHQCVRMKRHYATPCLLIDFSRHKGFALPSSGSAGGSSQQAAIDPLALTSKICLLALQFPELRLVWSPSVAFAARLFSLLKVGREQPDLQRAMSAGTEEDDESPTASGTGGSGSSASSSSSSASASAAFASAFSSSSSSSSSASASGTGGGPLAEAADGLDVSSSVSNAVDLRGSAGGSADAAQKPKDSTETSAQRGRGRGGRDGTASSQSPSSSEVVVEGIGGQGERDGEMAPESSASASASSSSGGEGGAGRVGQKEKGGGKSPVPTVFVIDDDDDDDVVDLYVGDGNGQASADGEAERKERFEKAGAGQSERVERKDASVEEESSGSAENSSRRVSTSSKKREGPLQEEEEATLPEVDAKKQIATAAKTDDQPENPRAASPSPASSSSASSPQESGTNKGQSQPSQGAAPETADRAASSASSPAPAAEPAGAPSGQASLQHQAVTADSASNHVAVDVLRKLPGVTPRNASIIVRKVESLAALCLLSEQEMITMIGPTCGRELFAFINKDGMQL
uniref:ERCC4 domain-containing protein n=1 Tax=Chromera velia CCMP2878 TaxID=1169474 RepID=A0A0G4H588_9ALVE|eukprot:Cvel_5712.t1-p1 / transcript=Cvel_5712.t1 / gene=Cvel_5712 / organism=Chromera_velia_CCMP2878 / gene_product=DNA repair endonuclease XPF, putative / transcript_product=DNA repair endonuclease XPF, putative / location=Cvel_scaffold270:61464-66487(-) / protein_length=842 / sequence_SO=supercontig / SO=protein_coding / is_pseudo=false